MLLQVVPWCIIEDAYYFLDEMATNSYQLPSGHSSINRVVGLHEMDPIIALTAQLSFLTGQIVALTT